jgi:predicted metal-dependent phosphoesterase TrpH
MILDLHSHSIKSDDGRAKVKNYCQWIRKRDIGIDGFVLSEHRQFDNDSDYSPLAEEFGLTILKASEVETEYGHILVYGVTPTLQQAFDFTRTDLRLADVVNACEDHGALPIPAHPGRPKVGMGAHIATHGVPEGIRIVETYNGGSRGNENDQALSLAAEQGYLGIGGSDAHIVSHIGRCATRFDGPVNSDAELLEALKAGAFEAVELETE